MSWYWRLASMRTIVGDETDVHGIRTELERDGASEGGREGGGEGEAGREV